ncbi:PorV/PorQ family protein [Aggregatimonas sangjinii]|uniref:PorV/PorQ family protein n=1 Tax=Aggregatimonas sangjinii TaxID=2583587 RepID=A0A5B7SSR3_9FLAO|nr:PorV/PorQ family protein [Aggregatimonas sangjinii]QCW99703.1 PorV/PorQ family protein [Aggregatimonas sangjinii]
MKIRVFVYLSLCYVGVSAQQQLVGTPRDGFLSIATDARAAAQGDIGVATATDAFSQFWNPSKYIFAAKKADVGITQIFADRDEFLAFSQLNLIFYNKVDDRSAYSLSVRNYAFSVNEFTEFASFYDTHEVAIAGSYALRLSDVFAMGVSGHFTSLKNKAPHLNGFGKTTATSLYGIDVSGFYNGNEIAYNKFNGRWRSGFNFSNLRGKSSNDRKNFEIYAPSTLKVGAGFDFIFNQDNQLGVTAEYKLLLDSYVENDDGEQLGFGLEGSVMAMGLEFIFKEKLSARTGYSHGINRPTDSFGALGGGFQSRYVDVDVALLIGLSQIENPIRNKLRLSLSLDLEEVFSNLGN